MAFHAASMLLLLCNPNPSGGWRHDGRQWSSKSLATAQGLDQRSYGEKSSRSEGRKEFVAGQSRMRREVSWVVWPQTMHEGL